MRALICAVTVVLAIGCGGDRSEPLDATRPSPQPPATADQAATARAPFEVTLDGAVWAKATPKGEGYALEDAAGAKRGKISVGADRVKLKDTSGATQAKVKVKDYGFKIYQGDEQAVAKAKRKGAGYKLKRDSGEELGVVEPSGGSLGGAAVSVQASGEQVEVKRGDTVVGVVRGNFGPKAASFLAATELSPEQRVAAMVFVQEHQR